MKKVEFFMDDSSIRNNEFVIENNINKVQDYTHKLTSSMRHFEEEAYAPTRLGNTMLSDNNIIL